MKIKLLKFLFFTIGFSTNAQYINTFAGNGTVGYSGDGGPATSAQFYDAVGIATDMLGNVYIADFNCARIRKINTSGIITTIAGNGTFAYSGDGGPALNAEILHPTDIAVDVSGNVYFTDNDRIRKINTSGIISTVAGNGTYGYSGDGGPATSAQLSAPQSLTIDNVGNLYIADTYNHRIRKVDLSGIISTVAGNGTPGYGGDGGLATFAKISPVSVAVDALGNIYASDYWNARIRKIDASGIITTFAGTGIGGYSGDGGQATSAQINTPVGIDLDISGNLYISEELSNVVRLVNSSGIITTIAGTSYGGFYGDGGLATLAKLYRPKHIAIGSNGDVFICDHWNERIRYICSKPPSQQGAISGNTIVCNNSSNTYSVVNVANATSYSWTFPSGWSGSSLTNTISLTTGLNDGIVSVQTSNGCSTSSVTNLFIDIKPDIASLTTNSMICSGETTTLSAMGCVSYTWNNGNTTSSIVVTPTVSTTYTLSGIDSFGCYGTSVIIQGVSPCIGIKENSLKENIVIYPNPAFTTLNIEIENHEIGRSRIEILNYLGQTVYKSEFKKQLHISQLSSGCYILKIYTFDNRYFHSKFIKE